MTNRKAVEMVLGAGLEPARISPHAPQACVSANFTTRAGVKTDDMIPNYAPRSKGENEKTVMRHYGASLEVPHLTFGTG